MTARTELAGSVHSTSWKGKPVSSSLQRAGRRVRLVTCVLSVIGFLAVPPAFAQIGVPVTDAANVVLEVTHNIQQDGLTDDVVFKVLQIYTTLRRLDHHPWREIDDRLELMREAAGAGGAIGYGEEALETVFGEAFPGTAGYAGPWYLERRDVVGRLRTTAQTYSANLQRQYELWKEARVELTRHRRDLENLLGQQEAYDILLSLGVFEVDEWRLVRHLMIQELTLQAVSGSEAVNEDAQRNRTVWLSLTGDAPTLPD